MSQRFQFHGWSFDASAGELTSPSGEIVILPAQSALVLEALLEAPGSLVPREDLYSRLWGDQVVDHEHGLNFCVRQLRMQLGDDAREPVYIETIRGRGYRFIAPVTRTAKDDFVRKSGSPRFRFAAAILVTGALSLWGSAPSPTDLVGDRSDLELSRVLQEARYLSSKNDVADVRRAVLRYQSAISRDPASSRAFAGLARAHYKLGSWGAVPRVEAFRSARDAARAALVRNGSSLDAHLVFGMSTLYVDLDWSVAEEHFRRAVEVDPRSAEARLWNARALAARERYTDAIAEAELALAIDPESREVLSDIAWFSYFAGDYDAAVETAKRALSLEPKAWASLQCLQMAYLIAGDEKNAREVTAEILAMMIRDAEPEALQSDLYMSPNWLTVAARTMDESCPIRSMSVESARLYAMAGDEKSAIELLRLGLSERLWWSPFVSIDPAFDDLRQTPEYARLMNELDLS